jgi:hypothetical protein
MNKISLKKGESSDLFEVTIKDLEDYTDYYSDLSIITYADTSVLGPLRINPVNNVFSIALSPAQTAGLPVGNYIVVLVVVKDVLGVIEFRKEISWKLEVNSSLLA